MINTKSKQLGKLFFTLVDENKQDQSVKADLLQLGLKNYTIIPSFPQRTWPFWLYQQMKDDGKSYAMDNNFLSLSNLRYRNWTLLSQPGSDKSALVDRSGLLHIPKTEYSLDFWLKTKSDLFFPSQSDSAEQRYNAGTGLFETQYTLDDLTVTASQFYKQFPQDNDLVFSEYSVENRGKSVNSVSFFLAVRPFTHEGLASLTDIQYLQSKTVLLNQQIALILEQKPDNVVCSNHDDGDVSGSVRLIGCHGNASLMQRLPD